MWLSNLLFTNCLEEDVEFKIEEKKKKKDHKINTTHVTVQKDIILHLCSHLFIFQHHRSASLLFPKTSEAQLILGL